MPLREAEVLGLGGFSGVWGFLRAQEMGGRGGWGGRREGQEVGVVLGAWLTSVGSKCGWALRLPGTEGAVRTREEGGEIKRLK